MNTPHELNYAYTLLALSAFIFLVLNLPVPVGRLTPAASSIFNIISSVTLLSPWRAGFPCVCREGVLFLFLFCFVLFFLLLLYFFFFFFFLLLLLFFFLNVLIKPILMGFTQSHCQTAVQTTVLDRCVLKLRQRSSDCTEKWKTHSKHCCCCCQLSNFKNDIQEKFTYNWEK